MDKLIIFKAHFYILREKEKNMKMSEITYYEEEIYCDWIKRNNCNNYKELIMKFMKDGRYMGSVGKYKKEKEINKSPYSDPDCEKLQSCSYYWELTQFLNQQEEKMKEILIGEFKYIAPSNCKKDDGQDDGAEGIITMRRSDNTCEPDIYLKSDQFGFIVYNFENDDTHPYGILYKIADKQQDDEKKEELYAFISDCINDTRTLGGGFLWPIGIWGGKSGRCGYNAARGGGNPFDVEGKYLGKRYSRYYIEDRVDLTLLEMKYLFKWILCTDEHEKETDYSNNIIFNIAKNDKKGIEWLRHFGSFDNYIEFFCFDDFMENGMPLDIVTSKLELSEDGKKVEGKRETLKKSTEYIPREEHSIYHLFNPKNKKNLEQMKTILNNVRILTIARSNRMQAIVDQCKNNK